MNNDTPKMPAVSGATLEADKVDAQIMTVCSDFANVETARKHRIWAGMGLHEDEYHRTFNLPTRPGVQS